MMLELPCSCLVYLPALLNAERCFYWLQQKDADYLEFVLAFQLELIAWPAMRPNGFRLKLLVAAWQVRELRCPLCNYRV